MEKWEIAIYCVLGFALFFNTACLVWVIQHIIRSRKEGTL